MAYIEDKPYVFVSYAHADSEIVLPIIKAMEEYGINVWYDGGIQAGTEWPEYIAEKVISCTKFLLFVSESYLSSQNCKREINFAISRKKEILSVYLENVKLSPGMEMQLGTYQALFMNRFNDINTFCNSLCSEHFFDGCNFGSNNSSNISLKDFNQYFGNNNTPSNKIPSSQNVNSDNISNSAPQNNLPVKNKTIAILFALFLGSLGVHKFYLKKIVPGILYLIFCWTYIPIILSIIDLIILIVSSEEKLSQKYNCIFK